MQSKHHYIIVIISPKWLFRGKIPDLATLADGNIQIDLLNNSFEEIVVLFKGQSSFSDERYLYVTLDKVKVICLLSVCLYKQKFGHT